jgi:hypothetical protein
MKHFIALLVIKYNHLYQSSFYSFIKETGFPHDVRQGKTAEEI